MLRTATRDAHRLHDEKGRWYVYKDHPKRPSITSIISAGVPKPALMYWGIKSVAEYAAGNLETLLEMRQFGHDGVVRHLKQVPWESRDSAADAGTALHDYAEAWITGQEPTAPSDSYVAAMADQFLDFCYELKPEFHAAELILHNTVDGYAGTIDGVATINGIKGILDYKTGKGVYGEAALQLAAGAACNLAVVDHATAVSTLDLFDGVECGFVVHVRPDRWSVHVVDDLTASYVVFQAAHRVAEWKWGEADSVLQLMYSGGV